MPGTPLYPFPIARPASLAEVMALAGMRDRGPDAATRLYEEMLGLHRARPPATFFGCVAVVLMAGACAFGWTCWSVVVAERRAPKKGGVERRTTGASASSRRSAAARGGGLGELLRQSEGGRCVWGSVALLGSRMDMDFEDEAGRTAVRLDLDDTSTLGSPEKVHPHASPKATIIPHPIATTSPLTAPTRAPEGKLMGVVDGVTAVDVELIGPVVDENVGVAVAVVNGRSSLLLLETLETCISADAGTSSMLCIPS
ncbi:hypothetical protein HDU96_001798 [Phlyctochytrium bullatum]|nr:hypothetical protein HDU96_001798 [Phlyctochytrium bullatum]